MRFWRSRVPADVAGLLGPDEHVLAHAPVVSGGHVVATSHGLWLPAESGPRRVGWDAISKAAWQGGALLVVESRPTDTLDDDPTLIDTVIIEDLPGVRIRLAEPGRIPQVVHERVEASIRSRHHRDLPGGGAWFVQRKVAGRGGFVLQVRPDPGTDAAAVRQVAAAVTAAIVGAGAASGPTA